MTVCIAVLPCFTDKIVLVSDQLLSSDSVSVDGAMKVTTICPGSEWYVMFAGDPSRFQLLVDRVRLLLGDVRNVRLTVGTVMTAFEQAYALELRRVIEGEILLPYGLDRDEFIARGRELLGDHFYQLMEQISGATLGVELIVAGLNADAQTKLFSMSARGVVLPASLPYHAIGCGAFAALGALYQVPYFPTPDLTETVYRACAAKFAAESVPGVGESTYALIIAPLSGLWTLVTNVDEVRKLWRTKGQPPIPSAARRLIERDLRRIEPRRTIRGRKALDKEGS